MNQTLSTFDLNLCSALVALGYELVELDRSNPRKVRFILHGDGIEKAERDYWRNKIILPAQEVLNAQKNVKSRIYSEGWLMLTDTQIQKFQALYQERFGEEISREEAIERGTRLIQLVRLVYKPITKAEYGQHHSKN